jgi:hypothetical protein
MELEDKILQLLAVNPKGISKEVIAVLCVVIADEFAVGFLDWYDNSSNDEIWNWKKDRYYTSQELLELYKQHLKQSNNG